MIIMPNALCTVNYLATILIAQVLADYFWYWIRIDDHESCGVCYNHVTVDAQQNRKVNIIVLHQQLLQTKTLILLKHCYDWWCFERVLF